MALQTSGAISLANIAGEFGGTAPHSMSEYYRGGAYTTSNATNVPTSGAISFSNFYGAVKQFQFTSPLSTTNYDSSTTWTKPSSGEVAVVYLWGGGGGGGGGNWDWGGKGGGGAACVIDVFYLSALPSTVSITIGGGGGYGNGTSGVWDAGYGGNGGKSYFGSYMTAGGGGRGAKNYESTHGSGGGGPNTGYNGAGTVTCSPNTTTAMSDDLLRSLLDGSLSVLQSNGGAPGAYAVYGGGGGASGASTWGGGGGGYGGGTGSGGYGASGGGSSTYGGRGGNGGYFGAAQNGTRPGGGGGGNHYTYGGGSGAPGRCQIKIF